MANTYKTLFSIGIRHGYYKQEQCGDFDMTPSKESIEIMRRCKLLFRKTTYGGTILFKADEGGDPIAPLPNNSKLSFALQLKRSSFLNYTDLPDKKGSEIYFISNKSIIGDDLTSNDWEAIALSKKQYSHHFSSEGEELSLSIRDPWDNIKSIVKEDQVVKNTETGISTYSALIDAESCVEGRYEVTQSETVDEVEEETTIPLYLSQENKRLKPLCVVDIFGDELDYGNPKNYTIKFNSKEVQWVYNIYLERDYTSQTVSLIDGKEEPELGFKETSGNLDLSKGKNLIFKSVEKDDDSQPYLIAYNEVPHSDFKIIIKKGEVESKIDHLPNPSIDSIKPEVFINI